MTLFSILSPSRKERSCTRGLATEAIQISKHISRTKKYPFQNQYEVFPEKSLVMTPRREKAQEVSCCRCQIIRRHMSTCHRITGKTCQKYQPAEITNDWPPGHKKIGRKKPISMST